MGPLLCVVVTDDAAKWAQFSSCPALHASLCLLGIDPDYAAPAGLRTLFELWLP